MFLGAWPTTDFFSFRRAFKEARKKISALDLQPLHYSTTRRLMDRLQQQPQSLDETQQNEENSTNLRHNLQLERLAPYFPQQGQKSGPRTRDEADATLPTKTAEFLNFCKAHGFVGFSFGRLITVSERDKAKKKPVGMPKWRECINKESWISGLIDGAKKGDKAFAIRTGSISGITVIDCDSIEVYHRLMEDFPVLQGSLRIRTAHGFHIYCRYVPGVVSNSNSFHSYPDVDIRNDVAIVFAPPTAYTDCLSNNCHSYVVDSPPLTAGAGPHSILDFPQGLLADLKNYDGTARLIPTIPNTGDTNADLEEDAVGTLERLERRKKNSSTRTQNEKVFGNVPSVPSVPNEDFSDEEPYFVEDESKAIEKAKEIEELLKLLPVEKYFGDYDRWFRVGAVIHHEVGDTENARDVFLRLSRRAHKYVNVVWADIEPTWRSYGRMSMRKTATIGSLYQWCKDDNPHGLWEFRARRQSFDFAQITTTSVAKYLVRRHGSDFIQVAVPSAAKRNPSSGPVTRLLYWDGDLWNELIAAQQLVRLIGDDVFFELQQLAQSSVSDEKWRAHVFRELVKLQDRTFKEKVAKDVLTELPIQSIQFDVCPEQKDNLHFTNGVLMLNQLTVEGGGRGGRITIANAFRKRHRRDYVTQTLPYDFALPEAEENVESVREIFRRIQPDEDQRRFQLSWLAYCLTGHTNEQRFKMNIGYSASNGKSTEQKIHAAALPLYTKKLHKTTLNAGNPKAHKFLIGLLQQPIRYAYIEELDRQQLDVDLLKDIVDGDRLPVEVLYGTEITCSIQAKINTCSNKDPNGEADKGYLRRGLLQFYRSRFVANPRPEVPNEFAKDKGLIERFEQADEWRRAYIWMLLPYVVDYYQNGLYIPDWAEQQFEEIAD